MTLELCRLLECLFTPTPVPLSRLLAGTGQELELFTSLPALLDSRSVSPLNPHIVHQDLAGQCPFWIQLTESGRRCR